MKLPGSTRRFFSEMGQGGWVIVAIFNVIAGGQFWVGHHFGARWRFISALAGLAVWLLIRPWRLGLLSQQSRREVFIFGTIAFIGWVLNAAILCWKI